MDKYEYKVRSEEITKLIEKEKYSEAVKIADTIDWRRVKSATMLLRIAALYRVSRRNEDSKEMLMLAYERYPTNRSVLYSLCELSIELDDVVGAIEYYKQFVKLAPKDNGVYTLRYRILEAQEASLEERIEILEELKKRDYQEEWAYELAYLYHRVGLSTKCVEECDDIILWFGDGPYVMKAMELKAMHVPLTDIQQKNYDIMLSNAGENYTGGSDDIQNDDTETYDDENYIVEFADNQVYSAENYNEGYDGQNYSDENYGEAGYDGQGYDTGSYGTVNDSGESYADGFQNDQNEAYADSGYGNEAYADSQYGNEAYADNQYGNEAYADNQYGNEAYADSQYGNEAYVDNQYSNEAYADSGYGNEAYTDNQYGNEAYVEDGYTEENYADNGYGQENYTDSYQDNGYTREFYVEQMYDENGNLINPETYAEQDYVQDSYDNYTENETYQDSGYAEQINAPGQYRNGLHLVESTPTPSKNSGDMSQYNTINLQKVVAESMKELFPDDDDVFAEDREKYNSGEDIGSITERNTRVFTNMADIGAADKGTDEPSGYQTRTGRIAQMVTGVSEAAPEPNTGAIKKVFVPGNDARQIKSDSDINELRDITERSVDDEHNRMENNDENVYHEKSIMDETDESSQDRATGPMKLDNVLVEWERIKLDNAKKHQEEIKKRVLTQTGKIFADFDNSIKSGILGDLEREEEEAQKSKVSKISKVSHSKDGFLEADVTGDILQRPVSDDDFDVEYITDSDDSGDKENTESKESAKKRKSEADLRDDYLEMLERVTSRDISVPAEDKPAAERTTEVSGGDLLETDPSDRTDYETGAYEAETYAEATGDYEAEAYKPEPYPENAGEYEPGVYTTENDEAEAYSESMGEYGPEPYPENAGEYEPETYSENVGEYEPDVYTAENDEAEPYPENAGEYEAEPYSENAGEYEPDVYTAENDEAESYGSEPYSENASEYGPESYSENASEYGPESYSEDTADEYTQEIPVSDSYGSYAGYDNQSYTERVYNEPNIIRRHQQYQYNENALDPEDAESIAEMAKEDALKTQEIKMNTADLSSLSEKIVATTKKEAKGAKREEIREFTPEEQTLFENFAVTKKIKKQIIHALDNMTLAAYTGNVIITGDAGLDTVRMAKNLVKEYQTSDEYFSGKLAKISGEKINQRNIKDIFEKLDNGGIIIEKANGMSEEKLYEMALNLNQENLGIIVIMEDTKKEITKLLEKQAMIADYFNIRIDLMEMDNNALVAYAKNYALALEYSIDELGTLALYTRIANMQSGNHVVTKDEVRDIIDEAIWKSKKSKIKNFVDVLFARRYDNEDMIVLKERDFM